MRTLNFISTISFTLTLLANCGIASANDFKNDVWPILVNRCIECHGEEKQEGELRLDSPDSIRKGGRFGDAIVPGDPDGSAIFELISLPADDDEAMPGRGDRLSTDQIGLIEKWVRDGAHFTDWQPEMQMAANALVAEQNASDIPKSDQLPSEPLSYNRDIRTILSNNCSACHGPDSSAREADLRLDSAETATRDLGGRRAITPGSLDESEMVRRLFHTDPDQRMPPKGETRKPSDEERLKLAAWVAQGAQYESHWAYVAPSKDTPPKVENKAWPRNAIDYFVLANLEMRSIEPAPEADRTTLIRRLSFDLIGLPPTPDEVKAFVKDRRKDAYEQLVDRLLASPHFGERLAIYWLDLVRYADTAGYHGDQIRGSSGYRDYIIDAFNSNMPFDQFTREQLAGDLIENATTEQLLASGYNRLNMVTREGGAQEGDYIVRYAADRVRTTASVWLGSSLGCAECHDHKFDPFTAKDFYSFGAFFADIKEDGVQDTGGNGAPFPPFISFPTDEQAAKIAGMQKRLTETPQGDADKRRSLKARINRAEKQVRTSVVTESAEPRMMRVLSRGNWQDESGEIVEPAVPSFLGKIDGNGERLTRMDLADWIANGDNPLTARVFVNRLWKLYFGKGISGVLDDLGSQGEWPQHPELLDHLALEFVESGWNIKHLIKQMVMSATYRQSSARNDSITESDPQNRLLSRQSRIRFEAELVRDNALKISGLLSTKVGGRSVMPYQPEGYYRELNFPTRTYKEDTGESLYRRGVYTHWQRTFLHPTLLAFDAPTREECTAERSVSNSPQQALALLNDPIFVEAARAFAERIILEGPKSLNRRIEFAYREALSRKPSQEETAILAQLYKKHSAEFEADLSAAEDFTEVGDSVFDKKINAVELAAWSSVSRTILNLHETIYRY
jgi:mono/diheme cytochrome c family protein